MAIQSLTPILLVDAIDPVLPFWTERLDFQVTARVPEDGRLDFVMLSRDGADLMIQTRASMKEDAPELADTPPGGSMLYIVVAELDPIVAALDGVEVLVPRRTTFYGADEIFVREPGGNAVGFAAFGAADEDTES
ncbi:MAG: hypothetical protein P8177_04255 [Gemmatimonadota bacterium]